MDRQPTGSGRLSPQIVEGPAAERGFAVTATHTVATIANRHRQLEDHNEVRQIATIGIPTGCSGQARWVTDVSQ